MKPRIKYITPYFYGIPCKKVWVCQSDESIALGNSPQEAYELWDKEMPKSKVGKWIAKKRNQFFDWLGC